MNKVKMKIGVMAPGSRIEPETAERVRAVALELYGEDSLEIVFHPQCSLSSGHFAGDDNARIAAFLEIANDPSFSALWFARGGYGSCRLLEGLIPKLSNAARGKTYLGYSDTGALLAALYAAGFARLAHGPMPSDIRREGGDTAIRRALSFLVELAPGALEASVSSATPTAAFNITVLSQLLGTAHQPDLSGHVVMLEEVSEQMYRIDRSLFHITSNPSLRRAAGLKLGRCSDIPPNQPDFGQSEQDLIQHWCALSGIPYLGRADIGHDIHNKIVPFGKFWKEESNARDGA